jgi:hypothetical protein
MPIPKSSVGAALEFLNKEKPNMSHDQKIAIALNVIGKPYKHSNIIKSMMKHE